MGVNVLIALAKGFEEIEAIAVIDVLRRAGCNVIVAKVDSNSDNAVLDSNLIVESQKGVKIVADVILSAVDSKSLDGIVFPGGWEGTQNLIASSALKEILELLNTREKIIAAICAAPLALFKHNILKGQAFTCYPSIEAMIDNKNYKASLNVVQDGNIITSRGPATALEFAFYLASVFVGEQKAKEIQAEMLSL
ncbi:DJ-1 family glyoxalase III [Helicobacter turcicus]|uniref:DJ-1/PfpI family protein n=1 Tax=Helicobacter turcicus TaxID=2867412 RepID=A0ABS7JPI8_9HELI|nr:DJ-1 family glyoxalase III [Helicobacter turcicus]MBX7491308.1 DJ-1/PfpI family protein [Helicobacter turcicus]MBX7546205.1 DJ-1/PfpI family protein [Helicobacter turcicus]